jgi:hypothetical protein
MKLTGRGQSIVEYTMIVTIVVVLLYFMGTSIKRGVQSLVKVTADQVGNQQEADQDFNDTQQGYMLVSNTESQLNRNKEVIETDIWVCGTRYYSTNTNYNETTYSVSNSITNGGFTPT